MSDARATAAEQQSSTSQAAPLRSDVAPRGTAPRESNPFPGLRPYGAAEAHLFFGRELHIEALLQKLSAQRLSAVIGVSGSGKSSLVLAGVLPRLMRGYRARRISESEPVRSSWRVASMRPGADPVRNLALALSQAASDDGESPGSLDVDDIASDAGLEFALRDGLLRRCQQGLIDAVSGLGLAPHENLLLIVDQFEELFRFRELSLSRDPIADPAAAFVKLLLCATEQSRVPIYVMLTMRADFLGDCVRFGGLAEAINEGQYLLPLLNRDERERVIRGPIGVANAQIQPALVQRLLNDARDMTDQLPVLQHALMRSFELWRSQPNPAPQLGCEHYELAGGMQQALSRHAEQVLAQVEAELGSEGVRVSEKLFRALTERGAHGRGVRRPCRASEVLAAADTNLALLRKVVARFASPECGFVVVQPAAQPLTPDSLLDISHEALMRVWGRLARWSEEEVAFASQLLALKEAQAKWEQGRGALLRDPELSEVLRWAERERLTPAVSARYQVDPAKIDAFLQASRAAQAEAAAAELDARMMRRVRSLAHEAKSGTAMALLAVLLLLIVQGSGLLDGVLFSSTRFNRLGVAMLTARRERLHGQLHAHLLTVISDAQTQRALQGERRLDQALGAAAGAEWRLLYAELITRLAAARAGAIVIDRSFPRWDPPAGADQARVALVEQGTLQLARAIEAARRRGSAVVIAGEHETDPRVRASLASLGTADAPYALGAEANSSIEMAEEGAAVFLPLLLKRKHSPNLPSLALAGVAGLWRTPHLFLDAADRTIFLSGEGGQREVGFAGLGVAFEEDVALVQAGDVPARQILDLSAGEPTRGSAAVVPLEDIVQGRTLTGVAGKLVLVGTQPPHAERYDVMECGVTPWSCQETKRSSLSLHLAALNALLECRALRVVTPFSQLLLILGLCGCVAWQCVRLRQHKWRRRGALAGLMLADLVLVAGATLLLGVVMDEAYHLLAMLLTYLLIRRLDRHEAAAASRSYGTR